MPHQIPRLDQCASFSLRLLDRHACRKQIRQERVWSRERGRVEAARWTEFDYIVVSGTRADDSRRMQAIHDAERLRRSRARFELEA